MTMQKQIKMNRKRVLRQVCLLFIGSVLSLTSVRAEEGVEVEETSKNGISTEVQNGMDLFQGNKNFQNGGPACIVCHNVDNEDVMSGGLFAKDLTHIVEDFPGLGFWLMNPDKPAMIASYKDHEILQHEGVAIEAFLAYAHTKGSSASMGGGSILALGGLGGLVVLLGLVTLIWKNRKTSMVKESIFARQPGAKDARF